VERGTPARNPAISRLSLDSGDANRLTLHLSEGTNYATGACYRVDGGRFLGVDPVGDA
jgi:hypothetical protein